LAPWVKGAQNGGEKVDVFSERSCPLRDVTRPSVVGLTVVCL